MRRASARSPGAGRPAARPPMPGRRHTTPSSGPRRCRRRNQAAAAATSRRSPRPSPARTPRGP
eukprot:4208400-Lingulodinium_polyedra.AAC.1